MLVVHPAYWGKSHGATLVKWGLELAKMDGVPMGVSGPEKGAKLYKALGFKPLAKLEFEGDELVEAALTLNVLRFEV